MIAQPGVVLFSKQPSLEMATKEFRYCNNHWVPS
jgi:hypothetical protein